MSARLPPLNYFTSLKQTFIYELEKIGLGVLTFIPFRARSCSSLRLPLVCAFLAGHLLLGNWISNSGAQRRGVGKSKGAKGTDLEMAVVETKRPVTES